jgi:hypothetical protein
MAVEDKWFFEEEEEEEEGGPEGEGGPSKRERAKHYIRSDVAGFVIKIIILVISAIVGFWVAGVMGLLILLPVAVYIFINPESGEGNFLKWLLIIACFLPFFFLVMWPIIGGFFGSQIAMVGSGLTDFLGLLNKQKDLIMSADYRKYLQLQDSVYDTSSQPPTTFSNPTVGFEINSFTISPDSGCYGLNTFQLFGVVKNTGSSTINNVTVGFRLDPMQLGPPCGESIGQLGYTLRCNEGDDCFYGICGYWLGEPLLGIFFPNIPQPTCPGGEEISGCFCINRGDPGIKEINDFYPGEVTQFVRSITMSDPVEEETITCRLFAYAQAPYHVKSRLEVTAIDTNYALLRGMSFSSVPAVQSIGPIKLKMDIGSQPVLDSESQRVIQLSLGNEGGGELMSLEEVALFVPKNFSSTGCEGGQFLAASCADFPDTDNFQEDCSGMLTDYKLFKLNSTAIPYSSYTCTVSIDHINGLIDLSGESRKSFLIRADAFYKYEVSTYRQITSRRCT